MLRLFWILKGDSGCHKRSLVCCGFDQMGTVRDKTTFVASARMRKRNFKYFHCTGVPEQETIPHCWLESVAETCMLI